MKGKSIVINACIISALHLYTVSAAVNTIATNNSSAAKTESSSIAEKKIKGYTDMLNALEKETEKLKKTFGEDGFRTFSIEASVGSMGKGEVRYTVGESNKGPYLNVMGELYSEEKMREFDFFTKALDDYLTFEVNRLEDEIRNLWRKTRPGQGNPTGSFETEDYSVSMTTSEFGGIPIMGFTLFPKMEKSIDGGKIFTSFSQYYGDFFPYGHMITTYKNKLLVTTDIRYSENGGYGITTKLVIRDLNNYRKYAESFISQFNPDSSQNESFLNLCDERMKEKDEKLEVVKLKPGNFSVFYRKDDYEDENGERNMVLVISISHPYKTK